MDRVVEDFRHAQRLLRDLPAWVSLDAAISGITADSVIAEQRSLIEGVGRIPKGGQVAMNRIFARLLRTEDGWQQQPRLFRDPALSEWKMDFRRDRVGVEVSFNHAEAIPWQFTRLNIAGESERVLADARIDVGIVITADRSLKLVEHGHRRGHVRRVQGLADGDEADPPDPDLADRTGRD